MKRGLSLCFFLFKFVRFEAFVHDETLVQFETTINSTLHLINSRQRLFPPVPRKVYSCTKAFRCGGIEKVPDDALSRTLLSPYILCPENSEKRFNLWPRFRCQFEYFSIVFERNWILCRAKSIGDVECDQILVNWTRIWGNFLCVQAYSCTVTDQFVQGQFAHGHFAQKMK